MYYKVLSYVLLLFILYSCEKQTYIDRTLQKQMNYDTAFEDRFGIPSTEQEWGDWILNVPSYTRTDNTYKDAVLPSEEEMYDVISTFGSVYDGINMVTLPKGDYWVKTIYKNDYIAYTDSSFWLPWFHAYDKMSSVSVYRKSDKKYTVVENTDSLTLIKSLDEYDGVMPQFAYFNELYSENYFDQRTIEYNGIYYVGFDFFADGFYKSNTNNYYIERVDKRDYIYDDWIIMLIPAEKRGKEVVYAEKRVMCEDLSDNYDFDFNDLVYDVAIVSVDDTLKTKITVQAVGTREEISICGIEAHKLFNNSSGLFVNSEHGGLKKEPKSFYIDKVITDIRDINVYTFQKKVAYLIYNEKGKSAKKICVDTNTGWLVEGFNILAAYPDFEIYVFDVNKNWQKNVRKELVFTKTY